MANKKISELESAGALTGTESVEIVQGGANVKTTTQNIANLGGGGGNTDDKLDAIATIVSGGTNYTLQASDLTLINAGANLIIEGNGTGTLTIPLDSTVDFPDNCFIGFRGFILVAATGGVTVTQTNDSLDCDPDLKFTWYLEKRTTNTWNVNNGTAGTGGSGGTWGSITGTLSNQTDLQTDLNAKVDEETFTTLTDGTSVTWNTDNKQRPLAKLTSTQSFTINMTNVKSGSEGVLKLIKNTASDLVLTFDTDFTNKQLNATLSTWTFTGADDSEYFLSYIVEGTSIEWRIDDMTDPLSALSFARLRRTAAQSISNNTITAISWDTEDVDNNSMWASSPNPTRIAVPGSGAKLATIAVFVEHNTNTSGVRRIWIYVNGSTVVGGLHQVAPVSTVTTYQHATFLIYCSGGDYIEALVYQNSGGALNLVSANVNIKIEDL